MLTSKDNLFHVVARDLVASSINETYLVASQGFEFLRAGEDMRRAIEVALQVVQAPTAADALEAHYNLSQEIQMKNVSFTDGCGGFLQVSQVVVQFVVRKIGSTPDTYRVLFTRLDAGQLANNLVERMDALEARMHKVEQSAR